jgi:ATP-dependent DNA helicase RecG
MTLLEKVKKGESRTLEFKEKIVKNKLNLLKTIVAFSNGSGGEILIGVDDNGGIIGFREDPVDFEEKILNVIYDSIFPLPNIFFQTYTLQDKVVFVIKVYPGINKPYFIKRLGPIEGVYVRFGKSNRKADEEIINELKRQRFNKSIDEEIDNRFDCKIINVEYVKQVIKKSNLTLTPEKYLELNRYIYKYNKTCNPTIAALLLFSERLPDEYEYCGLKLASYNSVNRTNPAIVKDYLSNIIVNLENIINDLKTILIKKVNIVENNLQREEELAIPYIALRESIINALCHRDYSITGSCIKVEVFHDRIEILSPGVLPPGITLEDIGKGISEIRNKLIVKAFRQLRYIEQLGTGINRIISECKKRNLMEPKFEEIGNHFKVTLFKLEKDMDDISKKILNLLYDKGEASSSRLASLLGIHQNTVLNKLKILISKGYVNKKGKGSNTIYTVT